MSRNFIIVGTLQGLSRDILSKKLISHGLRELSRNEALTQSLLLVYPSRLTNQKRDREMYGVKTIIKADLDATSYSIIADKMNLAQHAAQYCARSWDLNDFARGNIAVDVIIVRPVGLGCFAGSGIIRVDLRDKNATERAREMKRVKRYYQRLRRTRVLVSEYEMHALLFDGRKFHLRMYLLITYFGPGDVRWSLFGSDISNMSDPRAKILTSAAPWRTDDIDDGDVHDSHAKSTPDAFYFPTYYSRITHTNGSRIVEDNVMYFWAQARKMCELLFSLISDRVIPYPESRYGFTVFGMDVMIRDNIEPLLIEVNDNVGYDTPSCALFEKLQHDYFDWVWDKAIAPLIERHSM